MVRLFDPLAEHAEIQAALHDAARRVIDSGQYTFGAEVEAFEADLAQYLGLEAQSVVALGSGTDALLLALRAAGVGPGDEVIVPAFSFIATASVVLWVGARPVFADIDPQTLSVCAEDAASLVTPKTRALIVAHLFGHPADLTHLQTLCESHKIALIEDAAQALGAKWRGQPVGTVGDMGALSFFPTKHLGALGDAGALLVRDPERAAQVRRLRNHGDAGHYNHTTLGLNGRMSAIQAAMLRTKLAFLSQANDRRRAIAARYNAAFASLSASLSSDLDLPGDDPPEGGLSVPQPYVVRSSQRDGLARHLLRLGIETKVYYPRPLPVQPVFAGCVGDGHSWPHAFAACDRVLALPMYSALDPRACAQVITAVRDFFTV